MQEEVDQVHGEWVPVHFQLPEPRLPRLVVPPAGSETPRPQRSGLEHTCANQRQLGCPEYDTVLSETEHFLFPCCPTLFW